MLKSLESIFNKYKIDDWSVKIDNFNNYIVLTTSEVTSAEFQKEFEEYIFAPWRLTYQILLKRRIQ